MDDIKKVFMNGPFNSRDINSPLNAFIDHTIDIDVKVTRILAGSYHVEL